MIAHAQVVGSLVNSVAEVASAGSFRTFVRALKAADLVNVVEGRGPVTVFPFTDAAFQEAFGDSERALFSDRNRLSALLASHIARGTVNSADVLAAGSTHLDSVNRSPLDLTARGGELFVNGVRVVRPDVPAANGVIHVIDAVLVPTG
jgi:uncharacterized surface protein with fasciclin (FAS1) repeats